MNPSDDYVHEDVEGLAAKHQADLDAETAHEAVVQWRAGEQPLTEQVQVGLEREARMAMPKGKFPDFGPPRPDFRAEDHTPGDGYEPDNSHWYAAREEQRAEELEARLWRHADRQGPGWMRL